MHHRKPRNFLLTFVIVFLLLSTSGVLYLNNSIQVQLKAVEIKTERYQSQHQALSSQLQVVYEERSRMESLLQKEKAEHENLKNQLQHEKDSHEIIIEELNSVHKSKYEALVAEHLDTNNELIKIKEDLEDSKEEKRTLQIEDENHKHDLASHEIEKKKLLEENKNLQDQYSDMLQQKTKNEDLHNHMNTRLSLVQEELRKFNQLKNAMKQAGSEVIDLKHSRINGMSESNRKLFIEHFGENTQHSDKLAEENGQADRQVANQHLVLQPLEQDDGHGGLNIAVDRPVGGGLEPIAPVQIQQTSLCLLPAHPGDCDGQHNMYYYDPRSSSCLIFVYTGCGGNENKFDSVDSCEEACIAGFHRHAVPEEIHNVPSQNENMDHFPQNLDPRQQVGVQQESVIRHQKERADFEDEVDKKNLLDDRNGKEPNEVAYGNLNNQPNFPENNQVAVENDVDEDLHLDTENKHHFDVDNAAEGGDGGARYELAQAKEEFDRLHDENNYEDESNEDDQNAVGQFDQYPFGHDQQRDSEDSLSQNFVGMHSFNGEDKRLDNQMLQPPAAKVDQNPVIDVPERHVNVEEVDKEEAYEEEEYEDEDENYEDEKSNSDVDKQEYDEDQMEEKESQLDGLDGYEDEDEGNEEDEELNDADQRHEEAVELAERKVPRRNSM